MMVAYSFNKMFIPAIQSGTKCQTIRGERANARHARVGEPMQLYCGMRTKKCFKIIPDPRCLMVVPVSIRVAQQKTEHCDLLEVRVLDQKAHKIIDVKNDELREFAVADGFGKTGSDPVRRMHGFWITTYGAGTFNGVLIRWTPPAEGVFIG